MRKLLPPVTVIAVFALLVSAYLYAGTVRQADGTSAIVVGGVSDDASAKVGESLPEGAVVTTGDTGRVILEVAPDLFVELQPGTQLTIGGIDNSASIGVSGTAIPRYSINLMSGELVIHARDASLETASLLVITPEGNFSPTSPGTILVSSAMSATPDGGVVVAVFEGSGIASTTTGTPVPIGEGLSAVLDDAVQDVDVLAISKLPNTSAITSTSQSSTTRIQEIAVSTATPESRVPAPRTISSSPASAPAPLTVRPQPSPSPSPSRPQPSPSPSPSRPQPSPSPSPSRPQPSPSPSPSPSHTP